MPVATRHNKKGKKGGGMVFRFCTKASLYTLLVWIVNCSNSSQYGGNSYNVMNNGLGKAVDSRTLRLLAEAYEEAIEQDGPIVYDEEDIEQDGPVVYDEEAIEQDGPVVYDEEAIEQDGPVVHDEEAIEQDGPVVHNEEAIEQDGPVVHNEEAVEQDGEISEVAEEEQVLQKAPSVSSVQEQVMQKAPSVSSVQEQVMQKAPSLSSVEEEVVQKAPKNSTEEENIEYNPEEYAKILSAYKNREQKIKEYYKKRRLNFHENFEPTITANFDEVLKRCIASNTREQGMDGETSAGASNPGGDADPNGELQEKKKGAVQTGYLRMYQNKFRNVPFIDDFKFNEELKEPYIERKYGRPDLRSSPKRPTALTRNVERKINKPKVQEVKEKKKKRRRFCCF
ncbi:Uncharacterized protein PCOAH_00002310 [Plasmodium coatneyi]|uniref:Uncharacterized protein n=1 Tax=Plasmodium coatneyi TaxID=208452 RepID=A0A1B1DTE7_9APIC|nr:Uncharacterized protein PCOAH_00002310 [Plasmodium coatneyi]ANQ06076.1 Uncharacterized protein PCOAH_00002310 [Plasmodium coatneyi]